MSRLAAVPWKRPAVKRNVALSDLGSSGRKPAMNRCSRWKCFGATADGICSFLTLPSTLQEIEMRPAFLAFLGLRVVPERSYAFGGVPKGRMRPNAIVPAGPPRCQDFGDSTEARFEESFAPIVASLR